MIKTRLIYYVAANEIRNNKPEEGKLASYLPFWRLKIYNWFSCRYLSVLLTSDRAITWKHLDGGRLIYAPPGMGKTYFIVNIIAKLALELGKRVLIILPRAALCRQYRLALAGLYDPKILEYYTDLGLDHVHSIGPADIYLLQEITASVRDEIYQKKGTYMYLVLDEVHEFVTDATFNRYTSDVFDYLMRHIGPTCVRLYLTATPEPVVQVLIDAELSIRAAFRRPDPPEFTLAIHELEPVPYLTVYRFKADYSYIKVHFFDTFSEIEKIVQENCLSGQLNLKTLIFVGSKAKGEELMEKLNEAHGEGTAIFIDAESKNSDRSADYKEMIRAKAFKSQILIVTRFLDVGVDLKDLQLQYVIITSHYSEDIIQMLGRKRVDNAGRKVHLFLLRPNIKSLNKELNQLTQLETEVKVAIDSMQYPLSGVDELPFPLFIRSLKRKPHISYNRFTLMIIANHRKQIMSLLKHNDSEVAQCYQEMIIDLLPGCEMVNGTEIIANDKKEQAQKYIEAIVDQEMNEDVFIKNGNTLLEILGIDRRKENDSRKPTGSLHKAFERFGLPYHVENSSKGTWKFKRGAKS